MKKFVCLLLSFLILVCAAACSSHTDTDSPNTNLPDSGTSKHPDDPERLDTPIVSYENGIISWDAVDNADKYEIEINGAVEITYSTNYSLHVTHNSIHYNVRVKAVSESPNYLNSSFSDVLNFDTYYLSSPSVTNIIKSNDNVSASIEVDYSSEFLDVLINGNLYTTLDDGETTLLLNNINFADGYNSLDLVARSDNNYIIASYPTTLSIYKYADHENLRIENEKLLYTENGIDKEYVLEFCGAGEWTIRNYQDKALFPRAQIVFASDGVKMFFTKIHPATIIECVYTESPDRSSDTLYLKLRNFEPNFVGEDDSFFGYDYDRIEVILRYGSFTISYMSDMITLSDYTEYTFTFDFTDRLPPTITSIDVILHKDGNIASDPVSHQL